MSLEPLFTTWREQAGVAPWPLPESLQALYGGPLGFPYPATGARPYVFANFVATLDGVISYAVPGQAGGGPISGNNQPDRFIMGLLRACADAIVVTAGTVRQSRPTHTWTPAYIYPPAAVAFAELRRALGRAATPLTVVASVRGDLDWTHKALAGPEPEVLVVTTARGAAALAERGAPPAHARVVVPDADAEGLSMQALLGAVAATGARWVLYEGGPRVYAQLLAAGLVDELFLTLAPQVAGRAPDQPRPGLAEGHAFMPAQAPWAHLLSVKNAQEHLYLRYGMKNASD